MIDKHVDYLLIRNDENFLGGNVRWFLDLPSRNNSPLTVVFPADDEMTIISHGPAAPAEPGPPPWAVRGVKKRLAAPFFASAHYTNTYDAELAVQVLKDKGAPTIGLVGRSFIPISFYEYLTKYLHGARFVDMTDEVDQIKAIKSPEEAEFIKRTAELQDSVLEHVREAIRPGKRDFEIAAEALYSSSLKGSDRHVVLIGSGPPGTPVKMLPHQFQNRVIQEQDQISVLIEVNGPGGYWAELGRVFSIGTPSQELQDAFGAAVQAQQISLNLLKPGANPAEIWEANNTFLEKKGYRPERRLYAHGQGYDFVERPFIRYDESMKIKAGMNLTVHPAATNETVWAAVTDNYLITETGISECLHRTPKEIMVI